MSCTIEVSSASYAELIEDYGHLRAGSVVVAVWLVGATSPHIVPRNHGAPYGVCRESALIPCVDPDLSVVAEMFPIIAAEMSEQAAREVAARAFPPR